MSPIVYSIVIAYLAAVLFIGYRASKSKSAVDYMAAGQNQPYWVVGSGYVAEYLSLASFMGIVGVIYHQGFLGNGAYIGSVIGYIGGIAIFGPFFRRFGKFTIPDFLGDRYDSNMVRAISGIIIFASYFLYISVQIIGVSLLLEMLFGIPYWTAVLISEGVVVLYTLLGGMLANVRVDIFQLLLKWTAGIAITVIAVIKGGGIFEIVSRIEKEYPVMLTPDNGTGNMWAIWTVILVWTIGSLGRADTVSRAFLAKSEREVYKAILFSTPFIWVSAFLFFFLGVAGKVLIPGLEGKSSQNLYLIMAQEWFPPVITGLAFAGLLATAQSVASGQLMISSLAVGRDIYGKIVGPYLKKRPIEDNEIIRVTRYAMIVMAILTFIFSCMKLTWMLTITNVAVAIMGPAFLVTWLGGFFWKRATKTGAIAAMIIGALTSSYTFITEFSIPGLPWLVPPLFSVIITTIAFIIGSMLTQPSERALAVYERVKQAQARRHTIEEVQKVDSTA